MFNLRRTHRYDPTQSNPKTANHSSNPAPAGSDHLPTLLLWRGPIVGRTAGLRAARRVELHREYL
jgi:hypothetical protein